MSIKMHEVLIRKKFIDKRIADIQFGMKYGHSAELLEELFNLLGTAQNFTRSIAESNMKTKIVIGKTEADVDTAVRVRNTIGKKIKIINLIIKKGSDDLDIITLQRDGLVEEFVFLDAVIKRSDLETEVC